MGLSSNGTLTEVTPSLLFYYALEIVTYLTPSIHCTVIMILSPPVETLRLVKQDEYIEPEGRGQRVARIISYFMSNLMKSFGRCVLLG